MNKEQVQIFKTLAETVGNTVTKSQFKAAFSTVLDICKKGIAECKKIETTIERNYKDFVQTMNSRFDKMDAAISAKLSALKDGRDGKNGRDGKDGLDGKDGMNGKDGSPDNALDIRKKLESLPEGEKLSIDAIQDLEEALKKNIQKKGMSFVSGPRGIDVYVDGTLKAHSQYVNFIAGTGMTISSNAVGERLDLTFSASGSGAFSVLTATGTIDDSNKDFTFASEPTLVIVNGAAYQSTAGAITWTYTGGTVTLSQPVGTGGNIYALA